MIGLWVRHYQITEKLGKGGMGEVFRARDSKLDRDVALKFLPPELSRQESYRIRFIREAKAAASVDHPYICGIYEVGQTQDGRDFIAMEYVSGETLQQRLSRGPIPLSQALRLLIEITEAMEKAHQIGFIHRDLKPANLMLTEENHAKVMDFGLAKQILIENHREVEITEALTREGALLGTLPYMSPEQLRGERLDHRSDIFAFGVVLYETLTGLHPFRKDGGMETASAILSEEVAPIGNHLRETPFLLQRIALKLLSKDREKRYQLIHEVKTDLEDLKQELEAGLATLVTSGQPAARSSLALRSSLGLAALLLVGAALWSLWIAFQPVQSRPVARFEVSLEADHFLSETSFHPLRQSVDSQRIVFSATDRNATSRLYLRQIDELEVEPIEGTEGAIAPFLSPDGEWVGFFANTELLKISLTSGARLKICDIPSIDRPSALWTDDGSILFSTGVNTGSGISRVSSDGGTPIPVTVPDRKALEAEAWHALPGSLPDGGFLYTVVTRDGLRVAAVCSPGSESRVFRELGDASGAQFLAPNYLVFSQSNRLLLTPFSPSDCELEGTPSIVLEGVRTSPLGLAYFDVSEGGNLAYLPGTATQTRAVFVDRAGDVRLAIDETGVFQHPRLSPNGTQLSVDVRSAGNRDIYIHDLERGTRSRLTQGGMNLDGVWSPDGLSLTFRSYRLGAGDVFVQPFDSSEARLLMDRPNLLAGSWQVPGAWSSDMKSFYFTELVATADRNILLFSPPSSVTPFLASTHNENWPDLSPDGKWLAYVSDESGVEEVYVRSVSGTGRKTIVSAGGGIEPIWSKSKPELFYRQGDRVLSVTFEVDPGFQPTRPRTLFSGRFDRSPNGHQHYDVAPDGESFLMVALGSDSPPTRIVVVLDWLKELQSAEN